MYYLVSVDDNGMAVYLTRRSVMGFKKCCIFSVVDESGDDMLWYGSEEVGNVTGECEEDGTYCKDGNGDTDW
jgi:hypothetical protein